MFPVNFCDMKDVKVKVKSGQRVDIGWERHLRISSYM